MLWNVKRGQSTVEYAVVFAVVAAALLAMQVYIKRGAQGRLKDASDQLGAQFAPLSYTSEADVSSQVTRNEVTETSGQSTSTIVDAETQAREGGEEHIKASLSDEQKLF